MIQCLRCEYSGMVKAEMMTGLHDQPVLQFRKGTLNYGRSPVNVWVCPSCGYVELEAANLHKLLDFDT